MMRMRGVLWLALCMCLLCVCAHAGASDAASEKTVAQELEPMTLRSLRQEKDAQDNDDKDQSDQLRQGGAATAADDKQQPVGGRLIEKSGARAVHRVYDPVSGLYCELVGDCHPCPVSEKDEVYCRETSHLQELLCPRAPESNKVSDTNALLQDVRFKACVPEEKANPLLTVFLFEMVMAGAFAGAFVLLRKEQQNHLSSFDLRKDPRQRGPLLGAAGASKGAD